MREQQLYTGSPPTWLLADVVPLNKVVANWVRPSKQAREKLEQRIKREPPKSIWSEVETFFREYYRYAQHSGDTEALAMTVDNLGKLILKRQPESGILRPLLGWARLALDWDIGDAHHWNLVADCRIALGDYTGAENLLWEAVRRFPGNAVCRTSLAELLRERGRTDEAEALLRQTMTDFSGDAHCRTILAELLREQGKPDEAEALLRQTMEDFPSNEICRNMLDSMQEQPAAPNGKALPPQFGLAKKTFPTEFAPQQAATQLAAEVFDDDPLTHWAAERAPLIRIAFNFEQNQETHDLLIHAARFGGAAELAEAALHLLFPEDVLPPQDALRTRPDSVALRLLAAEQDAEQGLRIADDFPEAKALVRALYEQATGGESWKRRFRAAVLACADLTPPPVWERELA